MEQERIELAANNKKIAETKKLKNNVKDVEHPKLKQDINISFTKIKSAESKYHKHVEEANRLRAVAKEATTKAEVSTTRADKAETDTKVAEKKTKIVEKAGAVKDSIAVLEKREIQENQ